MKPQPPSRPKLPKASEQMKAWSSALEAEVADWPHVSTRSFFGFTAVYRKDKIFAALPRTRAWGTANSFAFKLPTANPAVAQATATAAAKPRGVCGTPVSRLSAAYSMTASGKPACQNI